MKCKFIKGSDKKCKTRALDNEDYCKLHRNNKKNHVVRQKRNIRKKQEFRSFLKTIKTGKVENWLLLAEALSVDKDTINRWKKTPEAQQAVADGINYAVKQMESSGKSDWRMWREKLKMLGVREKDVPNVAQQFNTQINLSDADIKRVIED